METLNIQRNAKKHQTIQQDKPKSMAHVHNNTKTKNTRTRTNTNTNRPNGTPPVKYATTANTKTRT